MTQPAGGGASAELGALVQTAGTTVAALYAQVEAELVAKVGQALDRGLQDATATAQITLSLALQQTARDAVAKLRAGTGPLVSRLISVAAEKGSASAQRAVEAAIRATPALAERYLTGAGGATGHGIASANAIAADLQRSLQATWAGVTRFADDAHRAAVADAATRLVLGREGLTPATAQQTAWRELAGRGVSGLTDAKGRTWNLATYAEMATRTATQRAYNQSHEDRMASLGIEFFTVAPDGHPCKICLPWEGQVLSRSAVGEVLTTHATTGDAMTVHVRATVDEAEAAGLHHPNCFPGGTVVCSPSAVQAADSRWYEGELVVIHTAGGDELSVTPNHPVLTPEGWVAAGLIEVGQSVVRYGSDVERSDSALAGVSPDDELVPTMIGEVFDSLRQSSAVTTVRMPAAAEQFHGDGEGGDVDVVLVDGFLQHDWDAESVSDGAFLVRGVGDAYLAGLCPAHQLLVSALDASDGIVGSGSVGAAFLSGHAGHAAAGGLTEISSFTATEQPRADGRLMDSEPIGDLLLSQTFGAEPLGLGDALGSAGTLAAGEGVALGLGTHHSSGAEAYLDGGLADAEGGRDLARRLTGLVPADHVAHVERRQFAGHVYNLQTCDGWYVAEGIVVHNCRHVLVAWFPGVSKASKPRTWTSADEDRYKAQQKQRAYERRIRALKLQQAGFAKGTPEYAAAGRRIRATQAALRAHLAQHPDLNRRRRREQTHLGHKEARHG